MKMVTIMLTQETANRALSLIGEVMSPTERETDSIVHALKQSIEAPENGVVVEQKWDDNRGWIGL